MINILSKTIHSYFIYKHWCVQFQQKIICYYNIDYYSVISMVLSSFLSLARQNFQKLHEKLIFIKITSLKWKRTDTQKSTYISKSCKVASYRHGLPYSVIFSKTIPISKVKFLPGSVPRYGPYQITKNGFLLSI